MAKICKAKKNYGGPQFHGISYEIGDPRVPKIIGNWGPRSLISYENGNPGSPFWGVPIFTWHWLHLLWPGIWMLYWAVVHSQPWHTCCCYPTCEAVWWKPGCCCIHLSWHSIPPSPLWQSSPTTSTCKSNQKCHTYSMIITNLEPWFSLMLKLSKVQRWYLWDLLTWDQFSWDELPCGQLLKD